MSVQLRCQQGKMYGILDAGRLEVKCRDKMCGYQRGITILHYFDVLTGELTETRKFQDPHAVQRSKEKVQCP